jgi:hypothetical protein
MSFESGILNASFGQKNLKFCYPEHEPQSRSNLLKEKKPAQINRRKRYDICSAAFGVPKTECVQF